MTLKKALCTVAFGIILLAANSHAQTIPADHASTSVTNTLAVERPGVVADESIGPSTLRFRKSSLWRVRASWVNPLIALRHE